MLNTLKGLLKIAPKKDERYYLNTVCVQHGRLVVTDGYRAVIVKCETPVKEGEALICRHDLANKIKLFKRTDAVYLRIDSDGRMLIGRREDEYPLNTVDGRFPDIDRALSRLNAPLNSDDTHGFNMKLMAGLCDAIATINSGGLPGAKFEFKGANVGCKITAEDAVGYLMPCRL